MLVRWSEPAADDLERICARIERDNSDAARRVARTIYDGCAQLAAFPNLGRASSRMRGRWEPAPTLHRRLSGQGTRGRDLAHLSRRAGLAVAVSQEFRVWNVALRRSLQRGGASGGLAAS
jgi:plasmid stabilization system protein ParE